MYNIVYVTHISGISSALLGKITYGSNPSKPASIHALLQMFNVRPSWCMINVQAYRHMCTRNKSATVYVFMYIYISTYIRFYDIYIYILHFDNILSLS